MGDLASLILRFGLGSMFAAHGAQKAFGMFNGPGIGGFTKMLQGLGFTAPSMWAYIAAYVELIGGLCLIAGIMTRVSSLLLLILIVTAGLSVHVKHGFFLAQGGFEYPYVIACGLLAILLSGGGKYSIYNKL